MRLRITYFHECVAATYIGCVCVFLVIVCYIYVYVFFVVTL